MMRWYRATYSRIASKERPETVILRAEDAAEAAARVIRDKGEDLEVWRIVRSATGDAVGFPVPGGPARLVTVLPFVEFCDRCSRMFEEVSQTAIDLKTEGAARWLCADCANETEE